MPADGQVHWGGLLSLVLFYGLVLWVARHATQRYSTGTASDLMVARRSMPLWVGVCTMSATRVGGGYVNGTAEAAYGSGLVWAQAPWGYALSLVVGGLVFARPMRRRRFTTMLDPLEARYGRTVAAVLAIPALSGEIFWTGAILTALGTTFGAILGAELQCVHCRLGRGRGRLHATGRALERCVHGRGAACLFHGVSLAGHSLRRRRRWWPWERMVRIPFVDGRGLPLSALESVERSSVG